MATTNDITGDKIKSRPNNDKFQENFERIFGKSGDKKKTRNEGKENDGKVDR